MANAVDASALERARALMSRMNYQATPDNIFNVPTKNDPLGETTFPVPLGTADPEDVQMAMRTSLIDREGKVPGMGVAVADDRVFAYAQRKKEALFEAQYQNWIMSQADFSNPAESAWWTERFPWIPGKKIQLIEQVSNLQKEFAKIQVRGPQTEEDFFLLWMKENNLIELPDVPVHMLNTAGGKFIKDPATEFQRGLFNPMAYKPSPPGTMMPRTPLRTPLWSNPLNANNASLVAPVINQQPNNPLFPSQGVGSLFKNTNLNLGV